MMQPSLAYGIPLGVLFHLIFYFLFFLVVWWLLRGITLKPKAQESPLDILNTRLAKGEISKKEYRELKKEME